MTRGDRRAVLARAWGGRLMIRAGKRMEFPHERGAGRKGCSSCDWCIAIHSGCHPHRLNLIQYFGPKHFGV